MSLPFLLVVHRPEQRERLIVRWLENDSGTHGAEIAVERVSGDKWARGRSVYVPVSEIFLLHDAIGKLCELAMTVRR